tara:strand:+ start:8528 stop:9502 length:975 start_codon:yes stop_codon:yes gene_type:complete
MKLTDLLKEIEDEQGGEQKDVRAQYDLAINPSSLKDALKALDNMDNYGIYAQNMRKPDVIKKVFGPSIPAQKAGAAWSDWNASSDEEKNIKILDIKNQHPEEWAITVEKYTPKYESWKAEDNEGNFEDWLKSLPGKSLPLEFYGKYGKNYFPMKTPENLKKYAGSMRKDIHYQVKDNLIIFPNNSTPFNPKSYLKKVLKTIMDNSGLEYDIIDVEADDTPGSTPIITKTEKSTVPPLSTTVDTADQADKLSKIFQNRLGEVPGAKYEVEAVGSGTDRKYKLVVTGITTDQRSKLQPLSFSFKQNLREENNFEMRRMLVIAGIIK